MEVKVLEVSQAAREDIMNAAFRGNNSIYNDIKSKVFSLSCRKNGESEEIKQFEEPAAVLVNLKDLNLSQNDIAQLCGIGFIEHEGSIVPVKLGGIYNQVNKTFTFYTEKYSYYTVMKVNNFININLTIRNLLTLANGRFLKIDVPPMIINNRTYVPLRFIGEALGAKFTWNAASKTVTYYIDGKEVNLVIDMPTEGMDAPPTIVNGRTMVPVRYIAESYGARVMWIPYEELVTIVK
jgi:hypothetical protein